MEVAKVFQTGRSQAVRLPKAFRFNGTEVKVRMIIDNFRIDLCPFNIMALIRSTLVY